MFSGLRRRLEKPAAAEFDLSQVRVDVAPGVRLGREPLEGYRRGWGLEYGGLDKLIEAEPLWRSCCADARIPSLITMAKRQNLYLLLTRYLTCLPHRDVIEFGAYQGGNAIFMALVMRAVDPGAKVYALDTFEGMPDTDKSRDAHTLGDFAEADLGRLSAERDRLGLDNLILVKGRFEDTFPGLHACYGLAHIDCDIYSGVKYAQDAVWPKMAPGGYVVYDDASMPSCLGATEAVEELIQTGRHTEQVWPHFVFRAGLTA